MENKRQLAINMAAQIVAFAVNFCISFFLTPYIIKHVGREAYGFVALGNNFINYASLITVSLNSMAGRFITIKVHQNNFKRANQYFSSVILANLLLSLVLSVPLALIIANLPDIVKISPSLLPDVRMLWIFIFLSFLIGLVTSTFGESLFAVNRLDVRSRRDIEANLLKIMMIGVTFGLFTARVWYIGLSTVLCTIYSAVMNLYYSRKFLPEIRFSVKHFEKSAVKELLSSGIWNSVTRVGGIALTELDLLLSNWFITAQAMGTMSIAKTVPTYVSSFSSSIVSVFMPSLTITYAKGDNDAVVKAVHSNIRILLFFNSIIYGLLFAFCDVFYTLWLAGVSDVQEIYLLSMLSIAGCFVSAVSYAMINLCTVTNKIRFSSLLVILTGILSFAVTFVLLKTTDLGLIAIAVVSVIFVVFRNVVFMIPYGAKCIGKPWYTFFPDLGLNIVVVGVAIGISLVMKKLLIHSITWPQLIFAVACTGVVLLIFNFFIILKKEERKLLFSKLNRKKHNH